MKRSLLPLSLAALLDTTWCQVLPYHPTVAFVSPNSSFAYIVQPSAESARPPSLLALDLGATLTTSQATLMTISGTLPFLQEDQALSYTPVADSSGNITVLAGNCSQGADSTQIWTFSPDPKSGTGNGTWTQHQTSEQTPAKGVALTGSNYLANGMAFSEYVEGDAANTNIFVFGGMCPFANSTTNAWTSSAAYSNLMLNLAPDGPDTDYDIGLVASTGPPIAEAGFSITPLPPTYSINAGGNPQTQQQNFVLLGGHTQSAFINMSQGALYSLPQEGWAFLNIAQPSSAKTDLARRQSSSEVEPRSGHTAILSEDGNSIILFGGWVGDVNTPAQPQLAVLSLNSGFGASGDWTWTIPSQSGSGLASGAGIYGHGAAMLPGGIMMVVGGYSIPAPSLKWSKRDNPVASSRMYLYNVSSGTWIDSYTPPTGFSREAAKGAGQSSNRAERIGLGAGLGVGAAVLIALVAYYFWYSQRSRRAHEGRERTLLSRSSEVSSPFIGQPFLANVGPDEHGSDPAADTKFLNAWDRRDFEDSSSSRYPNMPQMQQQRGTADSTGLFVDLPSPTRGLRKGMTSRSYQYHAAPRYDEQRISHASGDIHPIAEHENEDGLAPSTTAADEDAMLSDAENKLRLLERVLHTPDPFLERDPNPLGSHPVIPEMSSTGHSAGEVLRRVPMGVGQLSPPRRPGTAESMDASPNWVAIEDASDENDYRQPSGRVSPSKSADRTSSTLSDRSQFSTTSSSSITRTMSTRAGAIFAAAAARMTNPSPDHSVAGDRTHSMSTSGSRKAPFGLNIRTRPLTNGPASLSPPKSAGSDTDSFMTARTNFVQLQNEGRALLGGRPPMDRDDPYQRAMAAHNNTSSTGKAPSTGHDSGYDTGHGSAVPSRRRLSWMGSLRRALNAVSASERTSSMTSTGEPHFDERSSSSSPAKTRGGPLTTGPRRAVSDGGAFLRQKRGKQDWADDDPTSPYRDDPGDWGQPRSSLEKRAAEEDWDVEGAANRRDVQVMFSVPKARLRVVNVVDADRASVRSASDGALSRPASMTDLRLKDAAAVLRVRPGADQQRLGSFAEEDGGAEGSGARDVGHEKAA